MIQAAGSTPLADAYSDLCARGHGSDKGTTHSYIPYYETLLNGRRAGRTRLLELGVMNGYSLELWNEYFPDSMVWGMDLNPVPVAPGVGLYVGDCTSRAVIDRLPSGWDIVIDDASHRVADQIASFRLLQPKLTPHGLYIIEDIQSDADLRTIEDATGGDWVIVDLRDVKGRYDDVLMVYSG